MDHSKNYISSLIITSIFNTLIALVLYFLVVDDSRFLDVFIIAQITGLSICTFIHAGMYLCEKILQWPLSIGMCAGLILGLIFAGFTAWGYLVIFHGINLAYYYKNFILYVWVFGIVFGIPITYFFISREKLAQSKQQIQNEKINRLTMEKESAMTTLRLLQAQIEPHFLFNTLSSVISLFEIDVDKAKKMLIDVNEYLRISLLRTRQEMVTLSQELDLVRQYLEIFKIRMGDRLTFSIEDRTGEPDLPFPPLIIQPLVENAIKYGLEPKVEGGSIAILCTKEDRQLTITVTDNGKGLGDDTSQAGIGVNNVSSRLEAVFGEKAQLSLKQNHPDGISAEIKVPL